MTKKRETVTIELEGDEEMRTPAFDRECENVRLMNNLALEFFYIPLLHLTITSYPHVDFKSTSAENKHSTTPPRFTRTHPVLSAASPQPPFLPASPQTPPSRFVLSRSNGACAIPIESSESLVERFPS